MSKAQLKTSFVVQYVHKEIYTGGPVALDDKLCYLFCPDGSVVNLLDLQTGRIVQTLAHNLGDSVHVTAVACCVKNHTVAVSYTSGQLGIWKLTSEPTENNESSESVATLQSFFRVGVGTASVQMAPIIYWLEWSPDGTLIACATQREVLVYDVRGKWLTHWLRLSAKLLPTAASSSTTSSPSMSQPQGPVQICRFHPSYPLLYAADQLGAVWVWDLTARTKDTKMRPVAVLHHHLSVVTDITFLSTASAATTSSSTRNKYDVVFASRDKTVSVWDTDTHSLKNTLMTFESLEGIVAVTLSSSTPLQQQLLVTAGERGILRCWSLSQCDRPLFEQPPPPVVTYSLDYLFFVPGRNKLLSVTSDQNIQIHDVASLRVERTIVGFNDEIIDMALLDDDRKLVVATNSEQVRVYTLADMSCTLLTAHRDLVLCVDVTRDGAYIATGSKDAEIRVWSAQSDGVWRCVAVCLGHTDAVTSVAFAHRCPATVPLLLSASRDRTIKGWDLSTLLVASSRRSVESSSASSAAPTPISLPALFTYKAHDQEINSIALAPTDMLIATGSQDKTIKLWRTTRECDVRSLNLRVVSEWCEFATLVGHRRGVWCVAFSPTDQLLASASGDHLIKIWAFNLNTNSYRCTKTLEGHTSTVLKVIWTRDGLQCVSASADGVVILWNVFTEEAVNRFDAHTDKVWSVVLTRAEDQLITGGADSRLIFWRNVTEEEREAQRRAVEQRTLAEQQLRNSVVARDWTRAVTLALHLHHSQQLFTVFDTLLATEGYNASCTLTSLITTLTPQQLSQLLVWLRDWNTNAKLSFVAQNVLYSIFKTYHPTTLLELPHFKEILQSLLPYTERHYHRIDRLLQQSFIIDFLLSQMQLTADTSVQNDKSVTTIATLTLDNDIATKLSLNDNNNNHLSSKKTERDSARKRKRKQQNSRSSQTNESVDSVSDLIRKCAKLFNSESSVSPASAPLPSSALQSSGEHNTVNDTFLNTIPTVDGLTTTDTNESVNTTTSSTGATTTEPQMSNKEKSGTLHYRVAKKRRFSSRKLKMK
jgi:U3 small nucleolar RNA-associated protein 13